MDPLVHHRPAFLAFIVAPLAVVPVTILYFFGVRMFGGFAHRDDDLSHLTQGALFASLYGVAIAACYTLVLGSAALIIAPRRRKRPMLREAIVIGAFAGTAPWLFFSLQSIATDRPAAASTFISFGFLPLLALLCSVAVAETFWWLTFGGRSKAPVD